MSPYSIVLTAKKQGVTLYLKDGRLAFKATIKKIPTDLHKLIAENKDAIIEFLSGESEVDAGLAAAKQKRLDGEMLQMNFTQQRLWLIEQLEPGNSQYHLITAVQLNGFLDIEKMQQTLNTIVERHAVLRTVYRNAEDGTGEQVINEYQPFELPQIDLSHLDKDAQQQALDDKLEEIDETPFNLSHDLMLRVNLIRLNNSSHVLSFVIHHIAADGVSTEIFFEEMSSLYTALVKGEPNPLTDIDYQYADYAQWQRAALSGDALHKKLQFFRESLTGIPQVHNLPLDFPRPTEQSYRGGTVGHVTDLKILKALENLAVNQGATLFMVLMSAFSVLVARYSGEDDVVIGSDIANREQAAVENLIGFFVNTLVFRTQLQDNPSFTKLLTQTRDMALQVFAHQQVPFEAVVDELKPERSLAYNPVFQLSFSLQNFASGQVSLPKLTLSEVGSEGKTAKFDLSLDCYLHEDGLQVVWEYAADLFKEETITRMAAHFDRLLHAIAASPQQPVKEMVMISESEQYHLLHEFNAPLVAYVGEPAIHQRFEARVQETPEATAVVHQHHELSYTQLNTQANRLAHFLRGHGISNNQLVGIYAERSPLFLASMLGAMKAGGAYVPFDPINPRDRIEYMIENAEVAVLITRRELLQGLRDNPQSESVAKLLDQITVLCMEDIDTELAHYPDENLNEIVSGDDLAYMIYTSGSTGRPKGALVHHAGALNHIDAEFDVLGFMPEDKSALLPSNFLQSAASSSDVSVWQFLAPLVSGGQTVILNSMTDMPDLIEKVQRYNVHLMQCAPVVLQLMVDHVRDLSPDARALPSLRWMMAIAEALPVPLLNEWLTLYPQTPVMNGYGPSEASDDITEYVMREPLPTNTVSVPIGKPLPNLTMYVLDPKLQLQPIGVPGQLGVSGVGVGPGYWKNAEKTTEVFVHNPYFGEDSPVHGDRIYLTGDLGRWLPDGNLQFMGRIDNQVKVRGFRVELGEIEAALATLEALADVAVLVHKNPQKQNALVAYLVRRPDAEIDTTDVMNGLRDLLPDYMVPAYYQWLDKMPLNAADKIDRHRLPKPDFSAGTADFVAPDNLVEARLCDVWAAVLGLEKVGVTDNFFAIGGDSIMSVQVISRANAAGVSITVRQLFEHQTIRELAVHASLEKRIDAPQEALVGEQLLLPIQREFLRTDLIEQSHYNQSEWLETTAGIADDAWMAVLHAVVNRHDALRLRFEQLESGAWRGRYYTMADIDLAASFTYVKLQGEVTEAQQTLDAAIEVAQRSLQLQNGPLFHVVYFDAGDESRLFLTFHHMVIDGISWRVVLNDIQQALDATLQSQPIELSAKTSSFQQWGELLTEYAQSRQLGEEKAYWLAQLQLPVQAIPLDVTEDVNTTWANTQHQQISLDKVATQQLLNNCHQAYNTQINDLLLAAVYLGLQQWADLRTVRIDLEGHGREALSDSLDLGETLGWFTSVYPVVLHNDTVFDVEQAIISVKEQLRAVPKKGIGYGVLTEITRDTELLAAGAGKHGELIFNYLGQFDDADDGDDGEDESEDEGLNFHNGAEFSPDRQRENLLGLNGMVTGGQLQFNLDYNPLQFSEETMQRLAQSIQQALQHIVAQCADKQALRRTPSDFPLAQISLSQVDQVAAKHDNVETIYISTPMQQGMLFHSEFDASAYVCQMALGLDGKIHMEAFKNAWDFVVQRHSIYRTGFMFAPAQQVVLNAVDVPWIHLDWRDKSDEEQRAALTEYCEADKQQGFDVSCPPLMRLTLIQTADESYQLVWTYHHVLIDGWSVPVVFGEVMNCYSDFSDGNIPSLAAAAPYERYIDWLYHQDQTEAKAFWQRYLAEVESPTSLALDKLATDGEEGPREPTLAFDVDTTTKLQQLATDTQTTVNTVIQGIWAYLLHCYSGEQRVVFGETVSGRPASLMGVEDIVGLFINSLPVVVDFSEASDLHSWLKQMMQDGIERTEHSYVALTDIQNQSSLPNGVSLFDSLIVFENYPVEEKMASQTEEDEDDEGLELASAEGDEQTNFTLTLIAVLGKTLEVRFSYPAELFSEATMQRIMNHFQQVVNAITHQKITDLKQLPVLTDDETIQLVTEFNPVTGEYPRDKGIAELYEQAAQEHAQSVAIIAEDGNLTYQELNDQANQLAHYLREQGAEAGQLIGISMHRSANMLVGLLAIIKVGGAYVPIDPSYPESRLQHLLSDSNVQLILSQSDLYQALPTTSQRIILLDDVDVSAQPTTSLGIHAAPNELAYVTYTSGSTGLPKGVMVEQGSVVRLVINTNYVPLNTDTRVLLHSSISFDAATFEVWGPLLNGGIVVCCPGSQFDLDVIKHQIQTHGVNTLFITIAAFDQLSAQMPDNSPLRWIMTGGDVVNPQSIARAYRSAPELQLISMYGPTENTTFTTFFPIPRDFDTSKPIPLGNTINGSRCFVLSHTDKVAELRLAPIGVVGELYTSGDGVARGYLGQEAMTADKFIEAPVLPGERLYRTGDLVRRLPDGNLDFIGRADTQVKVRGFRIELGEIENHILAVDEVNETVVVARDEPKRLVAYLAVGEALANDDEAGQSLVQRIKHEIATELPDYMVPAGFVLLAKLPITANGKVDRRALPEPAPSAFSEAAFVAPEGDVENQLAQFWQQVLGLSQVGRFDNFFTLGGHSLLATQLLALIREHWEVQVSIGMLFDAQTLETQAKVITKASTQLSVPAMQRAENSERGRLSFAQHRLWLVDQIEPGSVQYNIPTVLPFPANANVAHLEWALQQIVERHEVLRTVYATDDAGEPIQIVQQNVNFILDVVALPSASTDEWNEQAAELAQKEAIRSFDLATDFMLRATLVTAAKSSDDIEESMLLLTMHHIASDGWSLALLTDELSELYGFAQENAAELTPEMSPLPPLALQYLDYAQWQREWLHGDVLAEQVDFWQQRLLGIPAVHSIPTDYPRPSVPSYQGAVVQQTLSASRLHSLQAIADKHQASVFMVLHAAFASLFHRYSAEQDIVMATAVANREQREVEPMIGFFVNTLVLRSDLSANPNFNQLLQQSREQVLGAFDHQQVPFEALVDALQPERNLSYNPLFQIMFTLHNQQEAELHIAEDAEEQDDVLYGIARHDEEAIAQFDLSLDVQTSDKGIVILWEYATDLFAAETIERMASHFGLLLDGLLADADMPISQVSILSDSERESILKEFNSPAVEYSGEATIHQRFEARVAEAPDAIAVVHDRRHDDVGTLEQLTYAQLNAQANQVAHFLIEKGVNTGDLVGIFANRSPRFLVAILGIMKAGAAYVPLDPINPQDRIDYMIQHAGAKVLFSEQSLQARLTTEGEFTWVDLGALSESLSAYSTENPAVAVSGDNLAYMIYTSGSTGMPKGALVHHAGALNHIDAEFDVLGFMPQDKAALQAKNFLQSAASSSDVSVWQFLAPVVAGGKTVILLDMADVENIIRQLQQHEVHLMQAAPVVLQLMVEHCSGLKPEQRQLPNLRWMMAIAEALPVPVLNAWLALYPNTPIMNGYGPSEASDDITEYVLDKPLPEATPNVPIGRPLPNLTMYVVNEQLQLQPVGVPGELCVSGVGVGPGYWQNPEKTNEVFVPNPFAGQHGVHGERLYRTGDLGRWLPNGVLEFMGRIDNQVKVRGFRIELGEIEAAIAQVAGVADVAVLAVSYKGQNTLAAYMTRKDKAEVETDAIREELRAKLPDYMMPASFLWMDKMPLNAADKIDRRRLPAPNFDEMMAGNYVAPRNAAEEVLCEIWQQVLGLAQVGIHDNFFEIGGHSLSATRLASAIRREFDINVMVRVVFEHQTVAALAELVREGDDNAMPPITLANREQQLPLSFAQQRLWLIDQISPGNSHYNMPLALQFEGELDISAMQQALNTVLQRHEVLRTVYREDEQQNPYQLILQNVALECPIHDFTDCDEQDREDKLNALMDAEVEQPFDLANDFMLRAKLVKLEPQRTALLLTSHHIASDGWSQDVLSDEIAQLYSALSSGNTPELAELPIQYADFAVWQREWLQGDVLDEQVSYWRDYLRDLPPVHHLPLDFPRPEIQTHDGQELTFDIDESLTQQLTALAQQHDATLFMLLHSAFSILMARYSGETDIVMGTAIANREQAELEGLIGFFVNNLVLRSDLSANPSFSELLSASKHDLLNAYQHQQVSFETLVDELQPERNLSYNPLFQVMLVLQNTQGMSEDIADLDSDDLSATAVKTQFDLSLEVAASDNLELIWRFATDLFRPETIEQMQRHFHALLRGIVATPSAKISNISLMSEADETQVKQWNALPADYSRDASVIDCFTAQVAATPEAIAIVEGDKQLTYQTLDTLSNQLAHHLLSLGVSAEQRIGLAADRSIDLIVATLAIVKAGGVYVPIDVNYPESRIKHILSDSGVEIVLAHSLFADKLHLTDQKIVLIDNDAAYASFDRSLPQLATPLTGSSAIYMIYTSGSTGLPKGVVIEHRGVVRLVKNTNVVPLNTDSVVMLQSSIAFDAATFEIWGALLNGGRTVCLPGTMFDLQRLMDEVEKHHVGILFVSIGVFDQMSQQFPADSSLQYVLTGGDVINPRSIQRAYQVNSTVQLVAMYGPTENTTYSTFFPIPRDYDFRRSIPLGNTITGSQCYVLNETDDIQALVLEPAGVIGELYVAGDGVAREYFNRDDLTEKSFIEAPCLPGERLYRTGDIVRRMNDGNLAFIGRADTQVKVRGYRIELGEIENVILTADVINDAIVVARDEPKRLVAYVVAKTSEQSSDVDALRHLVRDTVREQLPSYMTPAAVVVLPSMPVTSNGKVDRKGVPAPSDDDVFRAKFIAPRSPLETVVSDVWKQVIGLQKVGIDDHFFDVGGNSLLAVALQRELSTALEAPVSVTDIFNYPSIRDFVEYLELASEKDATLFSNVAARRSMADQPIAVIGMSLRFPDANTIDEFWHNLAAGKESITHFSDEQLLAAGVDEELLSDDDAIKSGVLLNGFEEFDANYFEFTPREVEIMDPQQRLLFEVCDELLEAYGYAKRTRDNNIGLFAGVGQNNYLMENLLFNEQAQDADALSMLVATSKDFAATRVSHRLNLTGPSISVNSACSTSLVAIHYAAQGLHDGSCDVAIAGGSSISSFGPSANVYADGGILSRDGHCRAFDVHSDGVRSGSGAAVVMLKRYDEALRDNDTVFAVIKGSAVNNDGHDKVGYTAPSVDGQARVIYQALANANIDAASISYVEGHGTATKLGDPIEVQALCKAYAANHMEHDDSALATQYCALSSLKTNIGHLDSAAGVASFIKATLALHHQQLPPTVNYTAPNPHIDFANSPFYVSNTLQAWQTDNEQPRRAAVSSFGIGGTNAHVILQEAPQVTTTQHPAIHAQQLLPMSAKTRKSAELYQDKLASFIAQQPDTNLVDAAAELQSNRAAREYRAITVATDSQTLAEKLTPVVPSVPALAVRKVLAAPNIVFMFAGQGSQYVNMSKGLYEQLPAVKAAIDECAQVLQPLLNGDIREWMFAEDNDENQAALRETWLTQPLLFVVEYALAQQWLAWGVEPSVMIGHSLGEIVAATLAGVFSLNDALKLVAARGRLMHCAEPGAMLAISADIDSVTTQIAAADCVVAAHNGPLSCVASGTNAQIEQLESTLREQEISAQRVATSHAYHSPMMDSILPAFREELSQITRRAPQRPFMSNVTGELITEDQALSVDYWLQHLRQGVLFSRGLQRIMQQFEETESQGVFLEVAPGKVLSSLVKQHGVEDGQVISSMRHPKATEDDVWRLFTAVGQVWQCGVTIDWAAFRGEQCTNRVVLPTYAFDKHRYWLEAQESDEAETSREINGVDDWFYEPTWLPSSYSSVDANLHDDEMLTLEDDDGILVFLDEQQTLLPLIQHFRAQAKTVKVVVEAGSLLAENATLVSDVDTVVLAANDEAAYVQLFTELKHQDKYPTLMIHGWTLKPVADEWCLDTQQIARGFYGLYHLARAIGQANLLEPIGLKVITNNSQDYYGRELISPENAMLSGVIKVYADEYPQVVSQLVDIDIERPRGIDNFLKSEVLRIATSRLVAFRDRRRWEKSYTPVLLPEASTAADSSQLKQGGVYLITGGLGGIGRAIAEHLASDYQAKLVLMGRRALPTADQWQSRVDNASDDDSDVESLSFLLSLQAKGADVAYLSADVSNAAQVQQAVAQANTQFGAIDGVIHSAGLPSGGLMALKQPEELARILAPKVQGTDVLLSAVMPHEPSFVFLCSSLASIYGLLGQYDYCAANAFQDAIAARYQDHKTRVVSVNWDTWIEQGMALSDEVQQWENEEETGIRNSEGQEAFVRAVASDLPHILCSTQDVSDMLRKLDNIHVDDDDDDEEQVLYPRPELDTPFVEASSDTEIRLAELMTGQLGIHPVGMQDDFFELGGDSLILARVVAEINEVWEVNIQLQSLFEQSRIGEMATTIDNVLVMQSMSEAAEDIEAEDDEDFADEGFL